MKTYKQLVSEIYKPNTKDEADLIGKHVIKVFDYPVENKDGLPFRDDNIRAPGPQHKKAPYHPPEEPAQIYQQTNEGVETPATSLEESKDEDDDTMNGYPYAKWPHYNVSYEKGTWDKSHHVVLATHDMRKSSEFKTKEQSRYHDEDSPGSPNRVGYLLKHHEDHQAMIKKGYRVKSYGTLIPSSYGTTSKMNEEIELNVVQEEGKYRWLSSKEIVNKYAEKDDNDLKDMYGRWRSSLDNLPKNVTYASHGHVVDKEFYLRKALEKKGIKVDKPKHPLVIEDFITIEELK